jgi:membrane-bound lytic murein transglycosylase D
MVRPHNKAFLMKALLASFIIICIGITVSFISTGFEGEGSTGLKGDGSYQVKSIKLPDSVIFAGERMPLENFDTRESLDRELLTSTYRHSSTILIIKRAKRYLPIIEKILSEYNIPDDLKYLTMAESELSNMISPAGATGFWQIMENTGREEGLEINSEVDERYNLEKSTRFACNYFLKSYAKYGNWTLSAASYNGGRNSIDEQIEIQGEYNYYDLLLNEETARYIFRVVAYKIISNDPELYGFMIDKNDLYPEIPVVEVKVDTAVTSFADFAKKFGTNYKTLKLLNPWLRKPYLTNKSRKEYIIKLPVLGIRDSQELVLKDL